MQQGLDPADLIALHVDEEQVGAAAIHADREFRDQIALQSAHAKDEEAAETNGEEDHARLISRTPQTDDRMAQGKPRRRRERQNQAHEQKGRRVQHQRHHGKSDGDGGPGAPRSSLPRRDQNQRRPHASADGNLQPIDGLILSRHPLDFAVAESRHGVGAADQQQRLDPANIE